MYSVCFQRFVGVFFIAAQSFTIVILLFWCGVYSGSIWERKYVSYRESV